MTQLFFYVFGIKNLLMFESDDVSAVKIHDYVVDYALDVDQVNPYFVHWKDSVGLCIFYAGEHLFQCV